MLTMALQGAAAGFHVLVAALQKLNPSQHSRKVAHLMGGCRVGGGDDTGVGGGELACRSEGFGNKARKGWVRLSAARPQVHVQPT